MDQTPNAEAKPTEAASAPSAPAVAERSPDSFEVLNGFLAGISEDKLKMAEAAGIPVKPLLVWAATITQEMKAIKENLPATAKAALVEAIQEIQQKQQTMQAGATAGQGGGQGFGIQDLIKLGMSLTSGGGGGADETTKWLAEVGKEQIMLSRVVFQEFAKQIVPDVMEKMKAAAAATAALKT